MIGFNGKEAKNASNYSKSLLLVGNWLLETAPEHFVTKIILTMCEIQEISYLPESKRNSKKILHLSNRTFIHSMFLVIDLKNNSKSLTQRKLFRTYFHSISRHATDQYRLFSGRSANTEKEEAFLLALKQILN